jgi:hypothetical protein
MVDENLEHLEKNLSALIDLLKSEKITTREKDLILRALTRIEREFTPFKGAPYSGERPSHYHSVTHINVGSGSKRIEGYTNIDIAGDPDIEWDVRTGLPFENDSVESNHLRAFS